MFSNLLSHVKRMRIKSSFLPPFFSFSLCFHFYFSEYPRGNFITYIAKYFHELHQGCQFDAKSKIPSEGLIMIIALRGKIGDAKIQKHPSLPF